jgi:hypothetical protein
MDFFQFTTFFYFFYFIFVLGKLVHGL